MSHVSRLLLQYVGIGSKGWVLTPGLSKALLTMFPLYLGLCILFDADILPLYSALCSDTIGHPLACKGLNDVVLVRTQPSISMLPSCI